MVALSASLALQRVGPSNALSGFIQGPWVREQMEMVGWGKGGREEGGRGEERKDGKERWKGKMERKGKGLFINPEASSRACWVNLIIRKISAKTRLAAHPATYQLLVQLVVHLLQSPSGY